jgi:ATP-dependent exoDNAse (exonuclease V) beta subunit
VRYTSKLEQSYFAADYHREFTRSYLDNLNLLYVAFTRAEAGMIVLAPKRAPQKEDNLKIRHVGQLLYDSILQSDELKKNLDEGIDVFSIGELEELPDQEKDEVFKPVLLDRYPTFDWRKKLVIRREGSEFFMEEKTRQRQRINYGILLHRALSRIQYKSEVDEVLKKMNFEGVIMEEEAILLKEKIGEMMNHPVIGNWFGKEWKVQTEAPVIVPGGRSGRLDRVIFKEVQQKGQSRKKAVIVDYKTGAKKAEDRKQVEEYARVLSQMGYVDVEAYLLYLNKLEIVLVVDKMNLSLF